MTWNVFDTLGAAAILGGGAAAIAIGGARLAPLATTATGIGILAARFFNRLMHADQNRSLSGKVKSMVRGVNSRNFCFTALQIATIALPIYLATRYAGCNSSTDIMALQTANPTRPKATHLANISTIKLMQEINGVSVQEIERRGRPGGFSGTGFLNRTENLKDVLQQDWKTVDAIGTSHIELANHLEAIWNAAPDCSSNLFDFFGIRIPEPEFLHHAEPFLYNPNQLENNTIGKGSGTQLLLGCKIHSAGFQEDIFVNRKKLDKLMQERFEKEGDWDYAFSDAGWGSDLEVRNPINDVKLTIGAFGKIKGSNGVIDYIKKYGFYEGGGSANPWRIDPAKLVALLTGKPLSSIQQAIQQFP